MQACAEDVVDTVPGEGDGTKADDRANGEAAVADVPEGIEVNEDQVNAGRDESPRFLRIPVPETPPALRCPDSSEDCAGNEQSSPYINRP